MTIFGLYIDPWIIVWLVILIVTVIIEINTVNLTTIWFSAASLVSLILCAFDVSIYIQIAAFFVVSIILVIATRPLVKRMQNKERVRTNADKVIGTQVIVTKKITEDDIGEVKAESVLWRAISKNKETYEVGDKVIVLEISGTKLIVSKEN